MTNAMTKNKLTTSERRRLDDIKANLRRNRDEWWVRDCEATFFLGLIEKLQS